MMSEPMTSLPGDDVAVSLQEHIGIVDVRRPPDNFFDVTLLDAVAEGFRPARQGPGGSGYQNDMIPIPSPALQQFPLVRAIGSKTHRVNRDKPLTPAI